MNDTPVVDAGGDQTIILGGAAAASGWSFVPWTGDADADISTEHTYTVAHNFGDNRVGSVLVNGVTFTENFNAAGTWWSIGGNNISWQGDDANSLTGASEDLGKEFVFNGTPRTVTFSGLTVGQSYKVAFYSVAWETGSRVQTFSAAGGTSAVINQDQYGDNSGIRITCTYTATATTQVFTITPQTSSTFHLYAMTHRVVEGVSAVVNLDGTVSDLDDGPFTTPWTKLSSELPATSVSPSAATPPSTPLNSATSA